MMNLNSIGQAAKMLLCPFLLAVLLCWHPFAVENRLLMSIGFLLLHECGHLLAAYAAGYHPERRTLKFLPFGICFGLDKKFATPLHDILISIAGPLVNFLFFLLFHMLSFRMPGNHFVTSAEDVNLVLWVFNMMPAGFLDGGRVLCAFLVNGFSYYYASIATCIGGIVLGGCMVLVSVLKWATLATSSSLAALLPLLLAGAYILFDSAYLLKKKTYTALYGVLNKNYNLDLKNRRKVRYLCYSQKTKLLDIMKNFCFNKYYVIYMIEDGKLRYNISEADVICLFCKYGNIRLESCVHETND